MYTLLAEVSVVRTTVRKWGNSLGVRIPSVLADDAKLADGAEVELTVRDAERW